MKGFFITGIGTEIGKTVVSAVVTEALKADYWKPVQCGDLEYTDSMKIRNWISNRQSVIHPEGHRLQAPMSPHAAAALENTELRLSSFRVPETDNCLVIEGAGGLYVPFNERECMIDLIQQIGLRVILVCQHYLGSINHSLLSIRALQARNIKLAGIIFNGPATPSTEEVILQHCPVNCLGRLEHLGQIDKKTIATVAENFRKALQSLLYEQD